MTSQQNWKITVFVDGVNTSTWDKMSGGEVDSVEVKYRPGGMKPEKSYGGPQTITNITVSRKYEADRDHTLAKRWVGRAGKARVTVHKHLLDSDGVPQPKPYTYRGTLKKVTVPDADSMGNSPSMIELEITPDGTVG